MLDTMTFTKTVGALCGALLVFLLGNWVAESLYHTGTDSPSYAIATGGEDAPAEAEPAEEVDLAALLAAADPAAGERQWRQCAACHALEEGRNGTGPSLHGVVGRSVAAVEGFRYSEALAGLGGEWTADRLSAFIADPRGYAPGTAMSFSGMRKAEDRASLIVYLAGFGGTLEIPAAGEPAAEEPAAEEPAVEEPAAEEPAAEEPAAEQPAAEEPAAEEPAAEEPAAEQPAAEQPAAEEPAADEPAAEQPAAEEPAAEEPAAEVPAAEQPAVEVPAVEVPAVEVPAADEPAAEQPAAEEPAAEEPAAEVPAAEEPAAEQPAVEVPAVEVPAADEPAAEQPAAEEPAAEVPAAEEPAAEEPAAEEPAAEEPAAEEPAAEEPAAAGVSPILAAGDAGRGARVWNQCRACHALESGRNLTGPHLVGIVGRAVGSAEGFRYSPALAERGGVWTPEALDEYLANPREAIPGNRMAFTGVRKAEDRANLIAYLATITE